MVRSSAKTLSKRDSLLHRLNIPVEAATTKSVTSARDKLLTDLLALNNLVVREALAGRNLGLKQSVELYPGHTTDRVSLDDVTKLFREYKKLAKEVDTFIQTNRSNLNIRSSIHQPHAITQQAAQFFKNVGLDEYLQQDGQVYLLSPALFKRLLFYYLRETHNTDAYIRLADAKQGKLTVVPPEEGARLVEEQKQAEQEGRQVDLARAVKRVVIVKVSGTPLEQFFGDMIHQVLESSKYGAYTIHLTTGDSVSARASDGLYVGFQSIQTLISMNIPKVPKGDQPQTDEEVYNSQLLSRRELGRMFLSGDELYRVLRRAKFDPSLLGGAQSKTATMATVQQLARLQNLTDSQDTLLNEILRAYDRQTYAKFFYNSWLELTRRTLASRGETRSGKKRYPARQTKADELAAEVRQMLGL